MTTESTSLAPLGAVEVPELRRRARSLRLLTALFLIPAGILAALFLYAPLALMVDVSLVPEWFKADYATYYPTLDQIQSSFKSIDWKAYNDSAKVFQDYYKQKLGQ